MVIKPIVLTEDGDTLELFLVREGSLVGRHSCGGAMHCHALVPEQKEVLHCQLCGLRIVTPLGLVKSPEEFEKWCASRIAKIKDLRRLVEYMGQEPKWIDPYDD